MSKVVKEQLWDAGKMQAAILSLAKAIAARPSGIASLGIIGIRTRGEFLGRRIAGHIADTSGAPVNFGTVDVTFHRDDFRTHLPTPEVGPSNIPFGVDDLHLILVDDVLYTGRTVRAAINNIMDFGRPASIELAVLVDRGGRELPIRANYIGLDHPAADNEHIHVHVAEVDGMDEVLLLDYSS